MSKKTVVIGSGFAGLAAACTLAKEGFEVTVLEKNSTSGGRARQFSADGFHFDMGPSWYWMPDIFEQFFERFGKKPSDYYDLQRLDPSYRIFFGKNDLMDLPANETELFKLFESYEPGSAPKLKRFLAEAKFKYDFGMREFVHKPADSPLEFFDFRIFKAALKLQLFRSISREVRSLFSDHRLVQLLEFPVLFLGSTPQNTPALYSLMNYADLSLGTWYPKGGMVQIARAMTDLAEELGVRFVYDAPVSKIEVEGKKAKTVHTEDGRSFLADVVVGSADYNHIEQKLLAPKYRRYNPRYWAGREMAPSSLIFYLGIKGRLKNLLHHNLFFDRDFGQHAAEIYDRPSLPTDPLFYVCAPSVTDDSVAPPDCENLFILMPMAPDLEDGPEMRERYFQKLMDRLEDLTGQTVRDKVIYRRDYCVSDFKKDYNSFRGNAYGLANTLLQTAFLKPKMRSPKVQNLFFAGQLTVPGPGVPPALISGQVAAQEIIKSL